MTAEPGAMPVTLPSAVMDATALLLLAQLTDLFAASTGEMPGVIYPNCPIASVIEVGLSRRFSTGRVPPAP